MAFVAEAAVVPPVKKSRKKSDNLSIGDNWKEATWKENIHSNINVNAIKRQRALKCHGDHTKSSAKATKASTASWSDDSAKPPMFVSPYLKRIQETRSCDASSKQFSRRSSRCQKSWIGYMYIYVLSRPHPDTWVDLHVVTAIMQTLNIPAGSFGRVKQCLLDVESQLATNPGKQFESSKNLSERKRVYKIQEGAEEAETFLRC